jgi:hypothetical protein
MKYIFLRKGIPETVEEELWQWIAYFNDGTTLKQFEDDGIFHQIGEIDQSKLCVFKMFSKTLPQVYAVPFDPNTMKLIHKYIITTLNASTSEEIKIKSYCFGYKSKNLPQNHQHLLIISPNNEAIVCGDDNIINFE